MINLPEGGRQNCRSRGHYHCRFRVRINKPQEYDSFARWLEDEGYFETNVDDNGNSQWRPRTVYLGTGQPVAQIQKNQAVSWLGSYSPISNPNTKQRSEFLNYFGRLLVTALFLERRLTSLNSVGVIDFQNQPPQNDLHTLYLDDKARELLFTEMLQSFGKAVWPDTSRGNLLCVRVSDEGVLPSAQDRLSVKKMAAYRSIETEGDGLKSYVAICVALLLGRRPICLIDEPEMCLHPPQAYNLGRFIGRFGASDSTVTLVATHSSQILRGVIQTEQNIQIVRLTRHDGKFLAHLVPPEILAEAVAKPAVKAESVLDGIFAESVVVVESDGDRIVYQTVWETLSSTLGSSVHFAAVGGTGGIADTCRLYRTLKIPVAIIADLDIVTDAPKLCKVVEAMAHPDMLVDLIERVKTVEKEIRKVRPTLSPEEARRQLREFLDTGTASGADEDIVFHKKLMELSQKLDRKRQIKRGGISVLPETAKSLIEDLIGHLRDTGVFLVPVGELEDWLLDADISESKENKWAWANAAAVYIKSRGASDGDVWDFIREVSHYLSSS